MRSLIAVVLLSLSGAAWSAALSASAQREIAALFVHLEQSNCEFNRNGSWYDARQATTHLRRKYDYLVRKELLTTTESFIEQAASTSSMSGRPYLVRCDGEAPVESRVWFTRQLEGLRHAAPAGAESRGDRQ